MADPRKVPIPGLTFTGGGIPVPPPDALSDSSGAYLYFDLSHPTNPSTGIPASAPNLVGRNAVKMIGGTTTIENTVLTLSNTFGAGGAVQRTSKGGLHIVPSRTVDVVGQVFQVAMTSTQANWMTANQSDWWFMSASLRVTRAGASGGLHQLMRLGQNSTTFITSINEGSSGTSVFGQPNTNATSSASPGLMQICVAGQGGSLANVMQWFISGGPISATFKGKSAAFIVYNTYVENLTKSGKSYAQVRTLAENHHSREHASGRWAGDTWTPPAELVAGG